MKMQPSLLVMWLTCVGLATVSLAQLRPEARPQPIHKSKPAPPADVAAEPRPGSIPRHYQPPDGFAGFKWGALRSTFERLSNDAAGVGAAFGHPVEMDTNFICNQVFTEAAQGCDPYVLIMTLSKKYQGGGFYVMSEYTVEGQGFEFGTGENAVLLHPVVYQFCANWDSTRRLVPEDFDSMNKFCGVRLLFHTETREQLRKLPGDHTTTYDRVLSLLIERFGKPDGFVHRGQVVIETLEGATEDAPDRKFSVWRWCPARDRALHTPCTASVTLSLDLATGIGTVLYSTPLLWEYAYAREHGGFKGEKLFRMLHARS